jgi:hypothetical protein
MSDGAVSLRSSSHLPANEASLEMKPVTVPFGRARLSTKPLPTGSDTDEHNWDISAVLQNRGDDRRGLAENHIWSETNDFPGKAICQFGVGCTPTNVDPHIAFIGPAQAPQRLPERIHARLPLWIIRAANKHADAPHLLLLLRKCSERPRRGSATER